MAAVVPPFDPQEFLQIARTIEYELSSLSGESALRTAVGRAYYALFLIARYRTRVPPGQNIHQRVIRAVKSKQNATGQQLDSLRRLRTTADYDMAPSDPQLQNWEDNWQKADLIAQRILPRIQTV